MTSDIPYRYQAEFDRLVTERKHFESSHAQLLVEYKELKERLVSNNLNTMECNSTQSSDMSVNCA